MSDQLLDLLRYGLLGLLYLFFLRVMWAVWTEVRTPAVAATPAAASGAAAPARQARRSKASAPLALRQVEPVVGPDRPLDAEMTIGRGPGCSIVVDDTFVSQIHARVYIDAGVAHVEDLGSTNGTTVNGQPLGAPRKLRRGDRIELGSIVLEAV